MSKSKHQRGIERTDFLLQQHLPGQLAHALGWKRFKSHWRTEEGALVHELIRKDGPRDAGSIQSVACSGPQLLEPGSRPELGGKNWGVDWLLKRIVLNDGRGGGAEVLPASVLRQRVIDWDTHNSRDGLYTFERAASRAVQAIVPDTPNAFRDLVFQTGTTLKDQLAYAFLSRVDGGMIASANSAIRSVTGAMKSVIEGATQAAELRRLIHVSSPFQTWKPIAANWGAGDRPVILLPEVAEQLHVPRAIPRLSTLTQLELSLRDHGLPRVANWVARRAMKR